MPAVWFTLEKLCLLGNSPQWELLFKENTECELNVYLSATVYTHSNIIPIVAPYSKKDNISMKPFPLAHENEC